MMEFATSSVTNPVPIWEHAERLYRAHVDASREPAAPGIDGAGATIEPTIAGLVAFAGEEMARNPIVSTGYSDAGMTANLADGAVVLLSPARSNHTRQSGVYGITAPRHVSVRPDTHPHGTYAPTRPVTAFDDGAIHITDPHRR